MLNIKLDDGRNHIFRFFSYVSGTMLYVIGILHFFVENWAFFGFVDLFFGTIVFINYFLFKEKSFSMDFLNILFLSISTLLITKGGLYQTGIYWVIGLPALFFISSGIKKGIIFSLIEILMVVGAIIFKEFGVVEVVYSTGELIMAIIVASILVISIYIYEYNIEKQAEKQQALIEEIQILNTSLQEKVDDAIKEIQEKDQMILAQSKFAVMGEMISMIAHQWRQPLNNLSLILMHMGLKVELNDIQSDDFKESMKKAETTLQHLSKTIDDFRELMKPIKNEFTFSVEDYIQKALELNESQMINNDIKVTLNNENNFQIVGKPNEFLQVVLNLMSNAKDALQNVENREINIYITNDEEKNYIHFCDNGMGIKEEYIEKIFEPYFSTKSKNGTGIGLYMSRVIIEKMNGKIYYKNIDNKTCFVLEFERDKGDKK